MKEYEQRATKIIMNTVEGVKAQIRKAYNKGYEDGKADTPFTDTEEAEKKAYNRGLADMLEAAKSMRMMTGDELEVVFGLHYIGDIFVNLSPSKIVSKYHAFKAQIKELEDAEIKVGDEVYSDAFDDKGIVTHITTDKVSCVCIICNGFTMMKVGLCGLHKTGRHFDQIAEVLAELRGAENDE